MLLIYSVPGGTPKYFFVVVVLEVKKIEEYSVKCQAM